MLTTFPGTHKMARCTVMRLADGRRLGGTAPSILRRAHAHRGNFVKKRHHPARMRQCAVPTGAGRAQKGAGTAVLNPLPKLTV